MRCCNKGVLKCVACGPRGVCVDLDEVFIECVLGADEAKIDEFLGACEHGTPSGRGGLKKHKKNVWCWDEYYKGDEEAKKVRILV